LTASPRLAANPANAILNYLYALLEGEATIAARVVGMDPGLGVLHADQPSRDSLAADLMEPVRPLVDRWVLSLLADRSLALADLYETRQGVCRLTPPLAAELTATLPLWRTAVGRVAETVAARLAGEVGRGRRSPTPITGRNRAVAQPEGPRHAPKAAPARPRCVWCGAPVEAGRRTCSGACLQALEADNLPGFVATGAANLARRRELGLRSEVSPDGRRRVAAAASASVKAAREWQRTHAWPADLGAFRRDVVPLLVGAPARALSEATGLSMAYCRRVKAGEVTPHPMWWETLEAVGRAVSGK
jgi:hypothetical protein